MSILRRISYRIHLWIGTVGGLLYILVESLFKNVDLLVPSTALRGQTVLLTGANRGLGFETLKRLLEYDCRVIAGVRDAEAMKKKLRDHNLPQDRVDVVRIDLTSLRSVECCAKYVLERYDSLNALVNNAGVIYGDYRLTEDGFENQLAVNFLGPLYLTHLLTGLLKKTAEKCQRRSRIVDLSSCAHLAGGVLSLENINMTGEYDEFLAYARTKFAQVVSTKHLNKIFHSNSVPIRAFAVHPGIADTDIFYDTPLGKCIPSFFRNLLKTPQQASTTTVYCCLSAELENKKGDYFENCVRGLVSPFAFNKKLQEKLHNLACKMLNIENFGNLTA